MISTKARPGQGPPEPQLPPPGTMASFTSKEKKNHYKKKEKIKN